MQQPVTPEQFVYYFIAVNFLGFAQFGWDKHLAEVGARRVPEHDLLWIAIMGGSLGSYLGRAAFRHKTRKQPFSLQLCLILIVQVLVALFIFFAWDYF